MIRVLVRISCVLLAAAISFTALRAEPPSGPVAEVTGRVLDASGAPVAAIIVLRSGTAVREERTGPEGIFRFENLPEGDYRLTATSSGLAAATRSLRVTAAGASVEFRLKPSSLVQSVEVTSSLDAVSGSAVKMDVSLLETPQAVSVIPREQLEQQAPLRLQEAIRYVAGVSAETYGFDSRGDWATVRGGSDWGQYLNGLRMLFGYYNNVRPEPFALDRIEVMRGPSSVLFGQSGFGGVLNLVSKRPLPEHRREIQVQLGSFQRRQAAMDVTGPVDSEGRWLYRIVAVGRDSNTQVDHVPDDRLLFAPSVTWRPRRGTSWTVLTNFQQDKSGSSVGFFPWQGTLLANPTGRIPTNTFISEPGFDEYRTEQTAIGYLFTHQFTNRWTVRQNFNYTDSRASYQTLYSAFSPRPMLGKDGRTLPRVLYISKPNATSPVIDTQSESNFRTGSLRHTFLSGIDFQHASIRQRTAYTSSTPIDVFAPVYGNYTVPALGPTSENRQRQTGVYAQDHVRLTERLSATLGLRRDWARSETVGRPQSINAEGALTGRAGVVYAAPLGVAPYFSYSQSFQPLAGADVFNNPYDPIRARQFEAGAKYQPPSGSALVSASVFDIREQNRLTPDPANPLNRIQTGEARIRGAELESRLQPIRQVQLLLNYTFLDARILRSNGPDRGMRLPVVPRHNTSLWATRSFAVRSLDGLLTLGGGVRYNGASFDGRDSLRTPSFTLVDLMGSFERNSWRFAVNAANLADKTYLSACLARGDCFYGMRRTVTATLGYRF